MKLRKIGCEDEKWMEMAQGGVQKQSILLAVFNFRVLLPPSQ
jgi:hypothetical protein